MVQNIYISDVFGDNSLFNPGPTIASVEREPCRRQHGLIEPLLAPSMLGPSWAPLGARERAGGFPRTERVFSPSAGAGGPC
jgi:hypothetical protein